MILLAVIPVFSLSFKIQAQSLQDLKLQCETAREEKIAPLRQKAIEDCIIQRRANRSSGDIKADCERFYQDFGEGGSTESGGFRPRLYHDLPECIELQEAERQQRSSGR